MRRLVLLLAVLFVPSVAWAKPAPTCKSPRNAIESVFLWQEGKQQSLANAAKCFERGGRSPHEIEETARRLKTVFDVAGTIISNFSALSGLIKPTGTSAPALDTGLVGGVPKRGTRVHTSFGTWNGYVAGVSTISFQWQRCSTASASSCTTNVGTNSQLYTPTADDVGSYLRVTATMTTRGQSVSLSSTPLGPVANNLLGRSAVNRKAVARTALTRKAPARGAAAARRA